jgi:uncharacterized protein YdeI (YjbR/CyaY-like superfamily)
MNELPRVRPRSRQAWRAWLQRHHASSPGVWLVYAKKHSGIASLSYEDAVEEALCFGWIDSKVHPIDEAFYQQVFTPRKAKSQWSASNRTRVERLVRDGHMAAAGLAAIEAAKASGRWNATKHIEDLVIPPDLRKALRANPDATRNWRKYTASRRKGVLFRLAGAKRPETRARYLRDIIQHMARGLTRESAKTR